MYASGTIYNIVKKMSACAILLANLKVYGMDKSH